MHPRRVHPVLLVILVCALLLSLARTWDLGTRVNRLAIELSALRADLAGLRAELHTLGEAARWYSRPELSVVCSETPNEVGVHLEWTFSELPPGASVIFAYRVGDGGWTEVPARRESGLTYAVTVWLPLQLHRPPFHITLAPGNDAPLYELQHIPVMAITYVISAETGEQARSGEPEVIDISKIRGYFAAHIEAAGSAAYTARVQRSGGADAAAVASMEFLALDGETVLEAVQLRWQDEEGWEGSIEAGDASALAFIVHWADGTVSEPVRIPLRD